MLPGLKFANTALYAAQRRKSSMCIFTGSQPHVNHFCQKPVQKADALNAWGFLIYLLLNFWEEINYDTYEHKTTWITIFTENKKKGF